MCDGDSGTRVWCRGGLARGSTISEANSAKTDESRRAPRICSVKFGTAVGGEPIFGFKFGVIETFLGV